MLHRMPCGWCAAGVRIMTRCRVRQHLSAESARHTTARTGTRLHMTVHVQVRPCPVQTPLQDVPKDAGVAAVRVLVLTEGKRGSGRRVHNNLGSWKPNIGNAYHVIISTQTSWHRLQMQAQAGREDTHRAEEAPCACRSTWSAVEGAGTRTSYSGGNSTPLCFSVFHMGCPFLLLPGSFPFLLRFASPPLSFLVGVRARLAPGPGDLLFLRLARGRSLSLSLSLSELLEDCTDM